MCEQEALLEPLPVLFLTGTTGAGKSTVTADVSEALAAAQVPHAALDLDGLSIEAKHPGQSVLVVNRLFP